MSFWNTNIWNFFRWNQTTPAELDTVSHFVDMFILVPGPIVSVEVGVITTTGGSLNVNTTVGGSFNVNTTVGGSFEVNQ
jgi:hypothetical protein